MSAMLTTTRLAMKETAEAMKAEGLDTKIMVGGAPVDQKFADTFNANYSTNASTAVDLATALVQGQVTVEA